MYSVLDLQKLVQMLSFLGISPGSAAPPHSVVLGGGTDAAPGVAGTILGSNGATVDPSFLTLAALGIAPLPLPANSVGASQITNGSIGTAEFGANVVGDGQIAWGRILKRVVGSIAALGALNVSIYQEAFATDFGHGNGGGGAYSYNAATSIGTANGGSIVAAAGGVGCWILQHNGTVDVTQFGAQGIGSAANDTAAFNAAVGTGLTVHIPKPTNYWYLTDAVTSTTPGQVIKGDGKDTSIIQIDTGFNMAAAGVFVLASAQPCPELQDFKITFVQPNTTVRASLTTYPPAVYAQNQPRCVFSRLKITLATVALDLRQNSGGAVLDGCEISAFGSNILLDGALDTVKIQTCQLWPFDMTANQLSIYQSSGTIGVSSGRCDDLHIDDCLIFTFQAIFTFTGSSGETFGVVSGTDFDTNCNLTLTSGELRFVGCSYSTAGAGRQWATLTGDAVAKFDSCEFLVGTTDTTTLIQVTGSGGALAQFSNCRLNTGVSDQSMLAISGTGSGTNTPTVMFANCFFIRSANITYASPTIQQGTNGRVTMTGCRNVDKGTGTGTFLLIGVDDFHNITSNSLLGWGVSLPAGHSTLVYANNV